jgi:hypothetical protein
VKITIFTWLKILPLTTEASHVGFQDYLIKLLPIKSVNTAIAFQHLVYQLVNFIHLSEPNSRILSSKIPKSLSPKTDPLENCAQSFVLFLPSAYSQLALFVGDWHTNFSNSKSVTALAYHCISLVYNF